MPEGLSLNFSSVGGLRALPRSKRQQGNGPDRGASKAHNYLALSAHHSPS